jgi:hypothetical protein
MDGLLVTGVEAKVTLERGASPGKSWSERRMDARGVARGRVAAVSASDQAGAPRASTDATAGQRETFGRSGE